MSEIRCCVAEIETFVNGTETRLCALGVKSHLVSQGTRAYFV